MISFHHFQSDVRPNGVSNKNYFGMLRDIIGKESELVFNLIGESE